MVRHKVILDVVHYKLDELLRLVYSISKNIHSDKPEIVLLEITKLET